MKESILKCIHSKITNLLVVLVGILVLVSTLLILLYSPLYNKLISHNATNDKICVSYTLFTEAQDLSMKHRWGNQSSKSKLQSNADENLMGKLREIRKLSPFGKNAKSRNESVCYKLAEDYPQVCYTQECLETALAFLKSINFKTDPCDDFYNFTCGNWSSQNPRPPNKTRWSTAKILIERAENIIADLVKSPTNIPDPAPINQVKEFYAMCTNESQINKAGLTPLIRMLKPYGGWPAISLTWNSSNFDINRALADAGRLFNIQIIINSAVGKSSSHNNGTTLYLNVGKPTLFSRPMSVLLHPKCHEDAINEFKSYFQKFALLLGNVTGEQLSEKNLEDQADDVINFEMRLARSNESQEAHNQTQTSVERSEFNLTNYIDHLLSTSGVSYADLKNKKLVYVDANYISNLSVILSSTSPRTVANYFGWRLGSLYSYLTTSEMYDLVLNFTNINTTPTISNNTMSREEVCAQLAQTQIRFSTAVQSMYVQHMARSDPQSQTKADITKMLGNLKKAFENLVNVSTWMDPQSKDAALNRIEAMKELVAYPDEYMNSTFLENEYHGLSLVPEDYFETQVALSTWRYNKSLVSLLVENLVTNATTDLDEWVKVTPQTVNAYNTLVKNLIVIPIAILQPPFYQTNGLQSLNYGGIGTILGHELAHAFRRLSKALSKLVNFEIGWANVTTLQTFKRKTDCILAQYDDIETPGGDTNGKLTLNENIGDNVGIREAFFAYQKLTSETKTEPRLPGLEMYTSEQLFFLSYGNTYCESRSPAGLLAAVTEVHSPNQFRTNIPLRNLKEFAQVWNCPVGSAMNPPDEERYVVW